MAKQDSLKSKITFGKRRKGKLNGQKQRGPKDKPTSKYRGQGR